MDGDKKESGGGGGGGAEKAKSMGDVKEPLEKCLAEHKGDTTKCKSIFEAFNNNNNYYSYSSSPNKPITPLMLRSGSLTDV